VPDIAAADVVAAVRSFRRGSAAGPSGLRGDHLREALGSAHGDEVAAHLAEVVQLLVRGDAPLEIAPHMAGAALHALPKPGGDVRPIAVGETLRRLASKCLCQAVREPAQRWLSPLQLGVAVSLGAEAAVHTARNWFHRNSGHANKAFLTIDFENAFNSVDRAAMLREVRLRLPGLAPYAEWCYGHHSRLLFDGEPLTSEAGVQQGDPLGPLLFSLAVQPALRAVRSGPWDQQPELAFAYLDDVCLAGSLPQLRTALARLRPAKSAWRSTQPSASSSQHPTTAWLTHTASLQGLQLTGPELLLCWGPPLGAMLFARPTPNPNGLMRASRFWKPWGT
jgi:hypothetical protein